MTVASSSSEPSGWGGGASPFSSASVGAGRRRDGDALRGGAGLLVAEDLADLLEGDSQAAPFAHVQHEQLRDDLAVADEADSLVHPDPQADVRQLRVEILVGQLLVTQAAAQRPQRPDTFVGSSVAFWSLAIFMLTGRRTFRKFLQQHWRPQIS